MGHAVSPYNHNRYVYHGRSWSMELVKHLDEWGVHHDYYSPVCIDEGELEWHQNYYDEPPFCEPGYPTESIEVYPKYKCWGKGI